MKEEWKAIEGYPHLIVSNMGRVYSTIQSRELKQFKSNRGYMRVALCKDGNVRCTHVHKLVAEAFIPNTENLPTIDHINSDKTDNRVENLQWMSYKQNTQKYDDNFFREKKSVVCVETHKVYNSIRKASKDLKINASTISAICKGEYDHYKGLHFKYLEEA